MIDIVQHISSPVRIFFKEITVNRGGAYQEDSDTTLSNCMFELRMTDLKNSIRVTGC